MNSKQLRICVIAAPVILIPVIWLYCFHQYTKSHIVARQAESYVYHLTDNKYDSVNNDILVSERTAIKSASRLLSEKYGIWHTLLWKPFDVYLINDYWLIYGPVSESSPESGPVIVINCHTGETRFLHYNKARKSSIL